MVKVKEVRTGKIWEFEEAHYQNVITSSFNKDSWELVDEVAPTKKSFVAEPVAEVVEDVAPVVMKKKPGRPKLNKEED